MIECGGGSAAALHEVQKYPADYNGVVVGGHAAHLTRQIFGQAWQWEVTHPDGVAVFPEPAPPGGLRRSTEESGFPPWSVGDRCCPVVHAPGMPQRSRPRLQPLHPLKASRVASCVSRSFQPLVVRR